MIEAPDSPWLPIMLSLRVSAWATLFALLLGGGLAWLMHGRRGAWATLFETCIMLPLVFPPTILGFYLLVFFGRHGLGGSIVAALGGGSIIFTTTAAVLAATATAAPIMYRTIRVDFEGINPDILGVARLDGAAEWQILLFIRVPLALRAILAGLMLAFLRALGEFGATLMIAGNIPGRTQTLSLAIYSAVMAGELDRAHRLAGLLVAMCLALILLLRVAEGRVLDLPAPRRRA